MYAIESEPHVDVDERPMGYCPSCQCKVRPARVDFGIGSYEYWGCKGVHHDWRDVCPTCETEVTDAPAVDDEVDGE
jgi:hypothetical protein